MYNNAYAGKRVLVTGHTGFKGSWLCQWLKHLGADVAGFSLYIPSDPALFEVLDLSKQCEDYRGDIRDLSALKSAFAAFEPEIVFHLAAQPIVLAALDDPKTTFDTNAGGTVNVLEAVRNTPSVKSVVMITSDKCYENVEWGYGYRETDHLGGKDPYSASKACAENIISAYWRSYFKDSGVALGVGRAGNVIGGGDWADDRVIPDSMKAWSQGVPAFLRSPDATRPWQHVLEPLSGYLWLGAQLIEGNQRVFGEAFNFGPSADSNYSVETLIRSMAEYWGEGAAIATAERVQNSKEAGLLKLCCDKALHLLNWRSTLDYETLVKMVTEWYQAFYVGDVDMVQFTNQQIRLYEEIAASVNQSWVDERCKTTA